MEKEQLRNSIAIILKKLIEDNQYQQIDIVAKLNAIDCMLKKATLSNLYKSKASVGLRTLSMAKAGLTTILKRDFCLSFDYEKNEFLPIAECTEDPIEKNVKDHLSTTKFTYKIHKDRLESFDKLKLYGQAQSEIIEIGIRLLRFKEYFSSKADSKFKTPIQNLLNKGVNFSCYVADPDSSKVKSYINDLSEAIKSQKNILRDLEKVQKELTDCLSQMNQLVHPGQFKLYKYQRYPNYHATVIDPEQPNGVIVISPYMYGLLRKNSPVIQVHKKDNKVLFHTYWKSIKAFTTGTKTSKVHPIIA